MAPDIAALVPMRHDSERVKGKNFRSFANRPLYHTIIETLLDCQSIKTVVIDTDSPFILDDAQKYFPTVKLLQRPEHLRAGTVSMNDVLINTVSQIRADYYLQTHSTNPLLTSDTISRAITSFLKSYPIYDSLFSVTRIKARLWDHLTRAINHNPSILLRTQDLPPVYVENSSLYLFTKNILESRQNRIGERPFMYEIDPMEALDIDVEYDFRIAEFAFLERQRELQGKI